MLLILVTPKILPSAGTCGCYAKLDWWQIEELWRGQLQSFKSYAESAAARPQTKVISGDALQSPSTTTLPLILGVGQIGEVIPAATAIFCPWPLS